MSWPNDPLTNYTAGQPVKSADLNAIQGATIGGKFGSQKRLLHASQSQAVNCTWTNVLGGYWACSNAPGEVHAGLDVVPGQTITTVEVDIRDTGSAVVAYFLRAAPGAVAVQIGDPMTSAASSSDQTLTQTLATAEVVADGSYYYFLISFSVNAMRYYGGRFTSYKP
jgi:hypothetical protein